MELASFFQRYARLYMAGDVQGVAELYGVPFLAIREGSPIHLPDRAAVEDHLAELMSAYRKAGAAEAEVRDIDDLQQGHGAVLATVQWRVRRQDGSVIREFRTSYQLTGPDPWRVHSYVNHDRAPQS